jgi:hypothetical protein
MSWFNNQKVITYNCDHIFAYYANKSLLLKLLKINETKSMKLISTLTAIINQRSPSWLNIYFYLFQI